MTRWKPIVGDKYYVLEWGMVIRETVWLETLEEERLYNAGNCFQTKKQAEKALEIVKEVLKGFHGEKTLFTEITKSPEVLAEKLVYCEAPERFCENACWCSVLLGKVSYAKKAEAIAATVAKLNEVEK